MTKLVERKTMRHVVQIMKDTVSRGEEEKFIWVDKKNMIADVLTKKSAPTYLIKEVLSNGVLNNQTGKQKAAGED